MISNQLFHLIFRRLIAYAPLFLPVLIGTILASSTTASISIYSETLRNLGLEFAINAAERESLNLRINFESPGMDARTYDSDIERLEGSIDRKIGDIAEQRIKHVRTSTFLVDREGEFTQNLELAYRGSFHFMDQFEDRFQLLTGYIPEPQALVASDGSLLVEGVILQRNATFLNIKEGDVMVFRPFWEDRADRVHVRVTGIVRQIDDGTVNWDHPSLDRLVGEPTLLNTLPVIVDEAVAVDILGAIFRDMQGFHFADYHIEVNNITADSSLDTRESIESLESGLRASLSSYRQDTRLVQLLSTYDSKLQFLQIPLTVVLLLVAGMVLYAVLFLAMLINRRQRADGALLMSRGATKRHLLLINATQALLIGGISGAVGPIVANIAISSTGYLPFFSALGRTGVLPTTLSVESYMYGGIGAVVSFIVLMLPSVISEDTNPLEQRVNDVRPPTKSFVQKWYIDIILAAMTFFLINQLNQQGSLVSSVFSGGSANLALLFVPVLFLFSSALLLLRIIPYITRAAAKLLIPVSTVWLALGLWQISRNPQNITRLILLLVLASGLGAFAANFGGTLDRSYEERALYAAGTQTRLLGANLAGTGPSIDFQKTMEGINGVEAASPVLRQQGSFSGGATDLRYELLGVDPGEISGISWWREDFSDNSIEELMSLIETDLPIPYGLLLPEDATSIGVWVEPVETSPLSRLLGVMVDRNGRYFSIYFGTLEQEGLHFLETEIKPVSRRGWGGRTVEVLEPQAPFTLLSIQIVQRSRSSGMQRGAFYIDSINTTSNGLETWSVLHEFDEKSSWNILDLGVMTRSDSLKFVKDTQNGQSQRALFTWGASSGFVQRGIYYGPEEYKIPMLLSPPLLRSLNQNVGDTVVLALGTARATGEIVGTVDHFPTLDPIGIGGFVVVNLDDIVRQQNLVGQSDEVQANEVWTIFGNERANEQPFTELSDVAGTARYVSRSNLISESKADPLVAAGWKTILMVSYISVLFLGIVGYISHAVLVVGERRNQFALLRTMGLTGSQIRLVVWFEHIIVIIIGIVAGFFIGQRTGSLLMPFLDRTETGVAVQPPFVLEINWEALGLVYLVMVTVFIVCTLLVVKIYNKLALGQALRIGED